MSLGKKKAAVIVREVVQRLAIRFGSTRQVREGVDASGNPTINIDDGTPTAGEQNVFVRLLERPSIGVDSLGQSQQSFGPHICQIVMEATAASASIALVTDATKLKVLGEVMAMAPAVELYIRANGGAPVVGDIVAGNLVDTFQNLYFPTLMDS